MATILSTARLGVSPPSVVSTTQPGKGSLVVHPTSIPSNSYLFVRGQDSQPAAIAISIPGKLTVIDNRALGESAAFNQADRFINWN